ncbi:regulator of Vps4 activity in the MVB pathway-domain-containing protein [Ephemerocybe angulata]|uniref:Regulator of Vps4 activity in the MVB pathway-domain-containing protein n=1 Tax=Ephemerocybe angulata TaxID=980116 RepID=A0A8H6M3K3_9AGAR|nr:regulator of Vps4 activity in the MVB pathway-domain-containing protein [Tulosesus angulatus]
MSIWNPTKAKVQLWALQYLLSVQRLRTLQQKKEAQAKAARRDIATLLEKGKLETARIKVETIINEDVHVELLELLELYCELLLARFGILDQNVRTPDPGISEGVCSIIRAAPSTELKELHIVRDILMHKYGREFSTGVMENKDGCVSERVMRKLDLGTPSEALVNGYLAEIARAYGVPWSPPGESEAKDEDADNTDPAAAEGPDLEKATEAKGSPTSDGAKTGTASTPQSRACPFTSPCEANTEGRV